MLTSPDYGTEVDPRVRKRVPVIDEERCTGCGPCVEACGPKSLEIRDGIAALSRSATCGSEEHCIAPCPEACIRMAWVPLRGNRSVGRWKVAGDAE